MKTQCVICGRIEDEYWMHRIPTGKRVQYVCDECFRNGGRQADYVTKRIVYAKKKKENR